jgi:hypothetical protein
MASVRHIGHSTWLIPGGNIPVQSSGPEPAFTSRDELFVMNTGDAAARITLTIFYTDREPVAGYELEVGARRVRRVRCNDLIDPEALRLGVDYGVVVEASVPVVVQFERVDTRQAALARYGGPAFPVTE